MKTSPLSGSTPISPIASRGSEKADERKADSEKLVSLFRKVLDDAELDVKVESLKDASVASLMTMNEDGRRMQEMMKMYAAYGMDMGDMGKEAQTLVLNSNNALVKRLMKEEERKSRPSSAERSRNSFMIWHCFSETASARKGWLHSSQEARS